MTNPLIHYFSLLSGFIGANNISPICRSSYPFPFIEKTLTFDWDNVGSDINAAIIKFKEDARKK